jgi:hypothetical protein
MMRIPPEVLDVVWQRQADKGFVSVRECPDGSAEAFDLWGGPERGHVVGSALPARPVSARSCEACDGHGFVDLGSLPRYRVCHGCDGLGWLL